MGFSGTAKRLTVLFLMVAGGGKIIYDDLNDKPYGITNLGTVYLTNDNIQDVYDSACGDMRSGKDIPPCGVALMMTAAGLTDRIQGKIKTVAPIPSGATGEQVMKDRFLQDHWQEKACDNMLTARDLSELNQDVDYCLTVAIKVADHFKADENKVFTRIAEKIKAVTKEAARKSPPVNSIIV